MNSILFMGSPDFAAESLKALVEGGYNVTGVVSQPDKPRGRGHSLSPTAVKAYALTQNIPVYTPPTLKNGELQEILDLHKPELIVVVAYGKILPEYVLNYPKYGCINIHASLLPMYRGASPINFVIVKGEKVTGITSMLMDKGLDTGDMLIKREVEIEDTDNVGILHDKLAVVGAEVLKETVDGLLAGTIVPEKQIGETCYAPLIDNDMRKLDMFDLTGNIYNKIRGFSPFPTAFTTYCGKIIKVYASVKAEVRPEWEGLKPGTLLSSKTFTVKTGDGAITFTDIAPEGKKRMTGDAFMAGLRLSDPYTEKLD